MPPETVDAASDTKVVEEIRRRYLEERDKRLAVARPGALELVGELAHYLDDPYSEAQEREPVFDDVDAVVIGAGFGGLLAAGELREAGLERIRIIDTAGDVGGVWYWNRYPGAMCDIESYIYLPWLDRIGTIPEYKYANAPVILQHARDMARHYNLYDLSLFHTAATGMSWDDETARWTVRTDRGDEMTTRFAVFAIGSLSKTRLPDIPGIEEFQGPSFHTSRWDYSVTGGAEDGNLTGLHDKVVGIIGTGATAVQCVPPLGRSAKQLYVFQRTPSTVAPRNNKPTNTDWAASLPQGWQYERMMNFLNCIDPNGTAEVDLIDDAWTWNYKRLNLVPSRAKLSGQELELVAEESDYEWMEQIRARVDSIVQDKDTAEALKPWYAYACKRPTFHDEYLQAFNLPNVSLVDTQGAGIDHVYANGLVANGVKYDLDCMIFATGFDGGQTSADKFGCEVVGRDGLTLREKWRDGLRTFHGIMTAGFPNLFFTSAPASQGSRSPNFMHMLVDNAADFGHIVRKTLERGGHVVEVISEAEDEWVNSLIKAAPDKTAFLQACTPGRVNNDGRPEAVRPGYVDFAPGVLKFLDLVSGWRAEGKLAGLRVT